MKRILLVPTPSRRALWAIQARIEAIGRTYGEQAATTVAVQALATIDTALVPDLETHRALTQLRQPQRRNPR